MFTKWKINFKFEIVCLIFLTVRIIELHALDDYTKEKIIDKVRLQDGTVQFDRWKELPFPLKLKLYAFNVNNPDGILEGAKPEVEEVGPFVYNVRLHKDNVLYDEENDRLAYKQYFSIDFDEDSSAFDENTEITVLNVPLQDFFAFMEERNQILTSDATWSKMFQNDEMFIKIPAKSFFFDGYQFCKYELLTGIPNIIARALCDIIKTERADSKILISDDNKIQYSLFAYKESGFDGEYQVSAGNEDIETLGEIFSWEGLESLNTWDDESSTCNRIRGTDSTIYRPFNDQSSTFDIFNTDTCKIMRLKTEGSTVYNGIEAIVAKVDAKEMSNSDDNSCYCVKGVKNLDGEFECLPNGFTDMSTCLYSNIVTSFPHMLWADSTYANTVTGLAPDEEKHASFAIIEPDTGIPLQVALRTQYNMILRPIEGLTVTESITPSVIPFAWIEQEYKLSEELTAELEDLLEDLASSDCVCKKY